MAKQNSSLVQLLYLRSANVVTEYSRPVVAVNLMLDRTLHTTLQFAAGWFASAILINMVYAVDALVVVCQAL